MILKIVDNEPQASSFAELRKTYPNVSFRNGYPNEQINPLGFFRYEESNQPIFDPTIQERYSVFVLKNNRWAKEWKVKNKTKSKIAKETKNRKNDLVNRLMNKNSRRDHAIFLTLLDLENRMRSMEENAPISAEDFAVLVSDRE